jgi:hypothetical protein
MAAGRRLQTANERLFLNKNYHQRMKAANG